MSEDDKKKSLEESLAALPSSTKAFVEGYGEGTAGWKSKPKEEEPTSKGGLDFSAKEGYDFNLSAATNRVCMICGAVVADTDLHDGWHERLND